MNWRLSPACAQISFLSAQPKRRIIFAELTASRSWKRSRRTRSPSTEWSYVTCPSPSWTLRSSTWPTPLLTKTSKRRRLVLRWATRRQRDLWSVEPLRVAQGWAVATETCWSSRFPVSRRGSRGRRPCGWGSRPRASRAWPAGGYSAEAARTTTTEAAWNPSRLPNHHPPDSRDTARWSYRRYYLKTVCPFCFCFIKMIFFSFLFVFLFFFVTLCPSKSQVAVRCSRGRSSCSVWQHQELWKHASQFTFTLCWNVLQKLFTRERRNETPNAGSSWWKDVEQWRLLSVTKPEGWGFSSLKRLDDLRVLTVT